MALGDLTPVGDRGSALSGGQRTRVALARALYSVRCHACAARGLCACLAGAGALHRLQCGAAAPGDPVARLCPLAGVACACCRPAMCSRPEAGASCHAPHQTLTVARSSAALLPHTCQSCDIQMPPAVRAPLPLCLNTAGAGTWADVPAGCAGLPCAAAGRRHLSLRPTISGLDHLPGPAGQPAAPCLPLAARLLSVGCGLPACCSASGKGLARRTPGTPVGAPGCSFSAAAGGPHSAKAGPARRDLSGWAGLGC